MRRFTEQITAVKLREDGLVVLVGDKMGKIELIELKQKLIFIRSAITIKIGHICIPATIY